MFSTMKKTDIIPMVEVLNIAPGTLLAESLPSDGGSGNELGDGEILVKGQGSSLGTHDVWDDDWSN